MLNLLLFVVKVDRHCHFLALKMESLLPKNDQVYTMVMSAT